MSKSATLNLRISPQTGLLWVVFAALIAYVYYPTFVWMVDRWTAADSYYAHGFLIPLVTLYWIYRKREDLQTTEKQISLFGLFLFAAGFGVQVLAYLLRFYFLSAFSFVVILLGIVLYLYGAKVFAKVWFPLAFLLLMIPLPLLVIAEVTLKMKFFVSEIAVWTLHQMNLDAIRQGSYIYTQNSVLVVGDPCSGLRSFLAFLTLGFIFSYDPKLSLWKRAVLIAAGLPLAVVSNVIRVTFLALVGEIYGTEYTGPGAWPHDVSGVAVFVIAFVCFLILKQKLEPRRVENS